MDSLDPNKGLDCQADSRHPKFQVGESAKRKDKGGTVDSNTSWMIVRCSVVTCEYMPLQSIFYVKVNMSIVNRIVVMSLKYRGAFYVEVVNIPSLLHVCGQIFQSD